jgi:prepilin-type N-terminal cleavage/methylation domain-containing protein
MRSARGMSLIETLVVLAVMAVVAGIAAPMVVNALAYFRVSGDARGLSNGISVAKMRAAADFSHVRLYVDLSDKSHHLELWDKSTSQWTAEGGNTRLSTGVSFSYGALASAPPNTQAAIAQAPQCRTKDGNDIANTACVVFNSRGIPVDATGAPTAVDAFYVTDGSAVYAVTLSATGMVRTWRANSQYGASWSLQ